MTELHVAAGTNYAASQHLADRANLVLQRWLDHRAADDEVVATHHERDAAQLPDPEDVGIRVEGRYVLPYETGFVGTDAQGRFFAITHSASSQWVTVRCVTKRGLDDALAAVANLFEHVPPRQQLPSNRSRFVFWTLTPNGPTNQVRDLRVPPWTDAYANNYAHQARLKLQHLHEFTPDARSAESGKLILLHGPPGTGKTTAIRSLAHSWRRWCRVDYIVDPDEFFDHAYYMAQVLLASAGEKPSATGEEEGEEFWRLIVVEDADDLIAPDAKIRSGQALSRLLNLCDGLVGQGLKVLVLLTTNAELPRLHEAVTRPGRCLFDLHLPKLTPAEAEVWTVMRGLEVPPDLRNLPVTLAQLYQLETATHERSPIVSEPLPGYV